MSNTPSLLPCPFCGCKAMASINKGESLWSHDVVDWTRVHCTNDECNAQTEATCEGYEPSAIEVWNRRTPQPVVREPLPKFTALRFRARRDKKAEVTLLFQGHETADAWVRGITKKGGSNAE